MQNPNLNFPPFPSPFLSKNDKGHRREERKYHLMQNPNIHFPSPSQSKKNPTYNSAHIQNQIFLISTPTNVNSPMVFPLSISMVISFSAKNKKVNAPCSKVSVSNTILDEMCFHL